MPRWFPLESNAEVMTEYAKSLGIAEPKTKFVDVYGLSDDLLSMVPQPVYAFCLVYPITRTSYETLRDMVESQKEEMEAFRKANSFFYIKQTVSNACGTVGILHALGNNYEHIGPLTPGGILDRIQQVSAECAVEGVLDPEMMGAVIGSDESLAEAHAHAAQQGETQNQPIDTIIEHHFVTFVRIGDRCVELDGNQADPILHGRCVDQSSFLHAAAEAIQARFAMAPDSISFGITAMVPAEA